MLEWAGGRPGRGCFGCSRVGLSVGVGRFQANCPRFWGGREKREERTGEGQDMRSWRKVGRYLGRADSGLPTYLRASGAPWSPNDDGHCPRDRGTQVDSSFSLRRVLGAWGRGEELSTPPDQMYSLTNSRTRSACWAWPATQCSVPSSCLPFLGKWCPGPGPDRSW